MVLISGTGCLIETLSERCPDYKILEEIAVQDTFVLGTVFWTF